MIAGKPVVVVVVVVVESSARGRGWVPIPSKASYNLMNLKPPPD